MKTTRWWAQIHWWSLGALLAVSCTSDPAPGDASVGIDAQVLPDAGPECTANDDCSDGIFCNGEEMCTAGSCEAGTPPDCADALDCTIDRCDEASRSCQNVAPDADEDGSRDATCLDADGAPLGDDCDDTDGNRFPGNPELCDEANHDEDCDDTTFGRIDFDADGYFDARCCNGPNCGNDCDDTRINVNLAATEACDGVDNDCDGSIDEGVIVAGLADADRDGFGDPSMPMNACPGRSGFVPFEMGDATDCDDNDPTRNPGQVEVCDMVDNDCNGDVDDNTRPVPWYRDLDGDGFGATAGGSVISCEPVADHVLNNRDCNDGVAAINPAAAEACDAIDNDCNGSADFEISPGNFEDDDNDGLPDIACGAPRGVDCDDLNPVTGPGTLEACDGRDNDCDGDIDEGAMDLLWFWDGDMDGDGSPANPDHPVLRTCAPAPGYVASGGDCDDDDPDRHTRAMEACSGTDIDCDGAIDEGFVCPCNAAAGEADCDMNGSCETNTLFDINHCGVCGTSCPPVSPTIEFSFCAGGNCIYECTRDWGDCNRMAIDGCERDLRADIMNCGGCDDACIPPLNTENPQCIDGGCRFDCQDGFADCGGGDDCETTLGTPENCSTCGDVCAGVCVADTMSGGFRCEGPMGAVCPGDNDSCGPECVYLAEDHLNCGSCGNVCTSGERCEAGACTMVCSPSAGMCGDDCVDHQTNPQHCGTCNQFCASGRCVAGACDATGPGSGCPMGLNQCSELCVNFFDNANHCGGCGRRCGVGGTCASGACSPPATLGLGPQNSCLIRQNGTVTCWGNSSDGRLGWDDTVITMGPPQQVPNLINATDVAMGNAHGCAIASGQVWCWGANNNGELGRGTTSSLENDPEPITTFPAGATFEQIEAGARHTCVRLTLADMTTRQIWCWGDNQRGQAGVDPAGGNVPSPMHRPGVSADLLATGAEFTCSGNATDLHCWGDNTSGQIGMTTSTSHTGNPTIFPNPDPGARGMIAGASFACVFDTGLHCWGDDSLDQYGRVSGMAWDPTPIDMPPGSLNSAVALQAAICLWQDSDAYCRGQNGADRLFPGDGHPATVSSFTQKTLPSGVNLIGGGGQHVCVVLNDERVHCWGANGFLQLGHGTPMAAVDVGIAEVTPP